MDAALCMVLGYFTGTVNPAYLFGKLRGFDIRERGSGNAGASNAVLMMGKAVGALCALFDVLKAYFAYKAAKALFPALQIAGILSGAACILGHIFPIWMEFRGGKGLACLYGVFLGCSWKLFCVMVLFAVAVALTVDYICALAISASVLLPVLYWFGGGETLGVIALSVVTAVMLLKHTENLKRIRRGEEVRVSYLWNKEKELERLKMNAGQN